MLRDSKTGFCFCAEVGWGGVANDTGCTVSRRSLDAPGLKAKGVFVSRDKRKDAAPAHIEGDGRIESYENRILRVSLYPFHSNVNRKGWR